MENMFPSCLSKHGSGKFSATLEDICDKYKLIYENLDDTIIETVSGKNVFTGKAHDFETQHNPSYSILGDGDFMSDISSSSAGSVDNDKTQQWDNMSVLSYSHLNGIAKVCKELERQRQHETHSKDPFTNSSESSSEELNLSVNDEVDNFWKTPLNDISLPKPVRANVTTTGRPLPDDILGNSFVANRSPRNIGGKCSRHIKNNSKSTKKPLSVHLNMRQETQQIKSSEEDEAYRGTSSESNEENSLSLRSHLYSTKSVPRDQTLCSSSSLLNSPFRKITLKHWDCDENSSVVICRNYALASQSPQDKPARHLQSTNICSQSVIHDPMRAMLGDSEESDTDIQKNFPSKKTKNYKTTVFSNTSSSGESYFSVKQNTSSNSEDDILTIKPKTNSVPAPVNHTPVILRPKNSQKSDPSHSSSQQVRRKLCTRSSTKKHIRKINPNVDCVATPKSISLPKRVQQNIRCDVLYSSDEENGQDVYVTPEQNRICRTFSSTMKLRSGKAKTNLFYR